MCLRVYNSPLGRKPFLMGEELTLADLGPSCAVTGLSALGFELSEWPNVQAWHARLMERPSWQRVLSESARSRAPGGEDALADRT